VVARGALRAVAAEPDRTGVVPASTITAAGPHPMPPPVPVPPAAPAPRPASAPARPAPNRRLLWVAAAAVLVVAAGLALLLVLGNGNRAESGRGEQAPPSRMIAQYEYQFALPNGWTQTGGDPAKLRTEVKPSGAEHGADLVLVEQTRLSFDSDTDRPRAVDKLRADFNSQGTSFSDFTDHATFAGRTVIHYRQRLDSTQATVDWYVLFKSHTQVSVGCQYTDPHLDTVTPACETIVRTMTITE
jgi:molecular chaperone DnaK